MNESYEETHSYPRGTKAKLIRRDGDKCAFCWSTQKPLHIHHYYPDLRKELTNPYRKKDGTPRYDVEYLVLLCPSCHGKVHTANSGSPFMIDFHKMMQSKQELSIIFSGNEGL